MIDMFSQEASSSSPASSFGFRYDVFLSFRGKDTRMNFTDYLYIALAKTGIKAFVDAHALERGVSIEPQLTKAIKTSRISLIIFSADYASSRWCLDELVAILDCRNSGGTIAVPIFFGVDPSDIQKQQGNVAIAFDHPKEPFEHSMVEKWKAALREASNLCGWDSSTYGNEVGLIKKVVEDILNIRTPAILNISIYPLGYDICDEYLNLFLRVGSNDIIMVGICGESGMGKTAIAKAAYSRIFYNFEASCFIEGVGQYSRQDNGLAQLQEKLLSDILLEGNIRITNAAKGTDMIKENLCSKRVLVVLDDVDCIDQLYALVGNRNWYGLGSKIIITTRDVQLLNLFKVDEIFMAQGRPPPPNVQAVWEKFRHSRQEIAGLYEYIQNFNNQINNRVRYLEDCLYREQQKKAIQAQIMSDLRQGQNGGCASTSSKIVNDTKMNGN